MSISPLVTTGSVVCRNEEVITGEVDRDLVLMDMALDRYFGTGPTGKRIWQLLAEPQAISALCDRLVAEYEVEPAECLEQTLAFVQALFDAGLVRVKGIP
jgi:hypothetical protein